MKAEEITKHMAKELGIPKYWVKSEERLQDEIKIARIVGENVRVDSEVPEVPEVEVVEPSPEVREEKLDLPDDVENKAMIFSIKCRGSKSPYYKYKTLLGM